MQRTLTFIVTADCTARCKYCYVVNKSPAAMSSEVARAAVDCLLADRQAVEGTPGLVLDFIGGEPLLRAGLIDEIICYAQAEAYRRQHPWFGATSYAISTNGDLYMTPEAQALTKWARMEIMITIDGPEDVHDEQRGAGSYARVMAAFPAWREQFPGLGTKTTLVPSTLPHLARSILHLLVELELPIVHANPVFENVWAPSDAALFEAQLAELAGRLQAEGIPLERCSLFSGWCGRPVVEDQNWCGAGRYMLAVGPEGDFYPCFRFAPQTLRRLGPFVCGNVRDGIDWTALAIFDGLKASAKSPEKCRACDVAGGCAWCTGFDYDEAGTIFHRATHICELHRARARVNRRLQDAGAISTAGHPRGARGDQGALHAKTGTQGAGLFHGPDVAPGMP